MTIQIGEMNLFPSNIKPYLNIFLRRLIPSLAYLVILINIIVLFSWIVNIEIFKGYLWGLVPIKANTSLCFILAGISLILQNKETNTKLENRIRQLCNLVIILLPFITLLQYFFGIDLGIDQVIAKESYSLVNNPFPGRMAPNTAMAFVFLGTSLFLTRHGVIKKTILLVNGILASFVIGFGITTIYGYLSGMLSIAQNFNVPLMAVSTSIIFISLGSAQLYFIAVRSSWHFELESNVLLLFLGGIGVLIIISLLTYRTVLLMMNNESGLIKNYMIRDGLEQILSTMHKAETDQRGYIITGNESYISTFNSDEETVGRNLLNLSELLIGNTDQLNKLNLLKETCFRKFRDMSLTIELRRDNGFTAAQSVIVTNRGKLIMDSIRHVCREMENAENLLLAEMQDESAKSASITIYSLPIGAFFSISFLVAALYIINIEYRKRRSAEKELLKANLELERRVKQRTAELLRSNAELEQFAYVASHDLQEPLRMVSSYTQLIARRYKDKLDSDAAEFINFAVDGALRMQKLIKDLLSFSRLATNGKEFELVDINEVVNEAELNLKGMIAETGAAISKDTLPMIFGEKTQLIRLFQNLLENSIKYRNEATPTIHIGISDRKDEWEFAVKDNGIGISEEYFDKIFQIFQRLHSKEKYTGTGIGLAICKRIVERHGGRIWVSSREGEGATFYFTLKKGAMKVG